MRESASILVMFAFSLAVTPGAFAQKAGHHAGTGGAGAGAVRMQARPAVHVRGAVTTTNGTTTTGNVIVLSPDSLLTPDALLGGFPTPGLGFDFVHLAAVNSGAGVRALIDPVTQHELALARAIRRETPVNFSSFPTFFPSSQPIIVEPSIIVVPQAVAAEAPERARSTGRAPSGSPTLRRKACAAAWRWPTSTPTPPCA